ncbi:MAG: M42 family metallopeptidase [Candidatus Odinarchaeum yellowstonii]|uniref:M42 family metallopeptidase n=1 Tax=Odinarchaeota yellowstonii (strain LCB_4) TaxID=1841599 RepID=A0AAF0D3M9_ODILC|nr:MAG: M42 family metallopeptidase [Candidatus Odinarchaeum yellowstonii]
MKELLKKLSEAYAPSGCEEAVREIITSMVREYVDELYVDKIGNLITLKKGVQNKPKILLDAHMDEIGMMVKYIDEKGFIRFSYTGGFSDQTVLNQRVVILTRKGIIPGVIGCKPPHLMTQEEKEKIVKRSDMFIDIGAESRVEAEQLGVRVGDHIIWSTSFTELAGNKLASKAFDNRVGCAILIKILQKLKTETPVYGVFTVMEEIGLRGAKTAAFTIEPDAALVFDIATAGDHPNVKEGEAPVRVGGGPVISVADGSRLNLGGGLITHPKIRRILIETAEENSIPYQLYVFEGGTTDGTVISLSRTGVPTGLISVPVRYAHTASELLSLLDVENSIKLATLSIYKIIETLSNG